MNERLTRQAASEAVTSLGWRYMLGSLTTSVRGVSPTQVADVARLAIAEAADAAEAIRVDLRHDRAILVLQAPAITAVTDREVALAHRISGAVRELGLVTDAEVDSGAPRSVQVLEIAIDALHIASIRPFWRAVFGYADDPGEPGLEGSLIDPFGQGPTIWFQQMDTPRQQRNRIHFDVSVPHDEAQRRIEAALTAEGTLLADDEAPAFWLLADAEGNEACITTWQGRDG